MNRQSRQAIERLGAKLDGVLRSHMVMANGTRRFIPLSPPNGPLCAPTWNIFFTRKRVGALPCPQTPWLRQSAFCAALGLAPRAARCQAQGARVIL
ncbi:hypothetical protein [Tritonibacter litoralis]|uniref:hypothetical protein n=1 Tax=Tritonibacter litoralis TaxID=2662264 RepID=UPI0031B56E1A